MDNFLKLVNYSEKSLALLTEFDTIIQEELKIIGGRFNSRLTCGPGWIFSRKKSADALQHLLECYRIPVRTYDLAELPTVNQPRPSATENPEYILTGDAVKQYALTINEDPDIYKKYYPIVVRLGEGQCVPISSPELKSEFWFADEGCDEEITRARTRTEDFFISENTQQIRYFLSILRREETNPSYNYFYLWLDNRTRDGKNHWSLDRSIINPDTTNAAEFLDVDERLLYDKGLYRKLGDDDRERLVKGYELMLEATLKRCRTWLRRYGTQKISVRTYWADR